MRLLASLVLAVALGACSAAAPPPSWQYAAGSPARSAGPSALASSASAASPTAQASPGADGIQTIRADVARAAGGDAGGSDAQRVVAGDTALATRLYRELATGPGNVVYSPYSIGTALSMTYGAARGRTADQLATALGIEEDEAGRWHRGRNDLDLWLERPIALSPSDDSTPLTIEPTNAIFGQDGFAFEADYLELLARDYGAGLQALDFAADPDAARAAINRWVAMQTKDRIRELLGHGTIDDSTRFCLANAIFFKASWATPFDPAATKPASFHRLDGSSVMAGTMHGAIEGDYARGDGWQMVAIPYAGATMTVIVPDAGRFDEVEQRLDPALIAAATGDPAFRLIHLALPRWSTASDVDLIPPLKRLGVLDLFDSAAADLTGMADADLAVGTVVHQATIDVDEAGTEAAAATAVAGGTTGGGPDKDVTVAIDRPFLYLVRDSSGEILFAGRVVDPTIR